MIFISIATPARPIKPSRREREIERVGDIYKHCDTCKTHKTI